MPTHQRVMKASVSRHGLLAATAGGLVAAELLGAEWNWAWRASIYGPRPPFQVPDPSGPIFSYKQYLSTQTLRISLQSATMHATNSPPYTSIAAPPHLTSPSPSQSLPELPHNRTTAVLPILVPCDAARVKSKSDWGDEEHERWNAHVERTRRMHADAADKMMLSLNVDGFDDKTHLAAVYLGILRTNLGSSTCLDQFLACAPPRLWHLLYKTSRKREAQKAARARFARRTYDKATEPSQHKSSISKPRNPRKSARIATRALQQS